MSKKITYDCIDIILISNNSSKKRKNTLAHLTFIYLYLIRCNYSHDTLTNL